MPKKDDEQQLRDAKRAYQAAVTALNKEEEAKWANVIGNILKNLGEYVEALKWIRIDYEISIKYLSEKQLIPACQTLGELHFRLQDFENALTYQKKHLELSKETNDPIEQQRASTQLGRTYHEMFLKSEDNHFSVQNAKKYFKLAMKLAEDLKKNPPSTKFSILKEYIDALNNLGMLEMDLDNLEEAEEFLIRGLNICNEEEVMEDDDGRSRLHHNLGSVYMEFRKWDKAREHIGKDISICRRTGHCQGEAKGYINLGELHYRVQKYDEAIRCYQKALDLAKSMEDEDALVRQIKQNIETVETARKVAGELKIEEQNLKKLARGTEGERKCLLRQSASLDRLIEKSSMIFVWLKHRQYAKEKKRIAHELCDKEKLTDSFLAIGESYLKLRNFKKAIKWYRRSWETYKLHGNLKGQALTKIDIGNVLDSAGDWKGAFTAFEEGYRIALRAQLTSVQLSALENMHYSYMIRFDNFKEARSLQSLIDKLKVSIKKETEATGMTKSSCSETETDIDDCSPNASNVRSSLERSMPFSTQSDSQACAVDFDENSPLISFLHPGKKLVKLRRAREAAVNTSMKLPDSSPRSISMSAGSRGAGRKRAHLVVFDDECDNDEELTHKRVVYNCQIEEVATSNGPKNIDNQSSLGEFQDLSPVVSKCAFGDCTPVNREESTCSYRSRTSKLAAQDAADFGKLSPNEFDNSNYRANCCKSDVHGSADLQYKRNFSSLKISSCCDRNCQHIVIKIEEDFLHIEPDSCIVGDKFDVERLKVQVACLHYLRLPYEKTATGLVPIIHQIIYDGKALEAIGTFKDRKFEKGWLEVSIGAWLPKHAIKLYIDCCKELSERPNLKVLQELYNLEVSEDEFVVSDCELQDMSVIPLLNALREHKTVAVIDLSHNTLGNRTMERLKQVFMSSRQSYGGLILDLHCNRLGPTSLFQICECPVLYSRLEVLNISGNRLTDACASYLSTVIKNCKALYSLNIEQCSITSRTIQKITDSLGAGSVLSHLFLGFNHPISGNAIVCLLQQIATLTRFEELSLKGIKLSKHVVDSLCQLAKSSSLSGLILGSTGIGNVGALQLTESLSSETRELVKLDLSSCGLTSDYFARLNPEASLISGILELNLGGNPMMQEGANALTSLLKNPQCCLRVLVLPNCQLGLTGILQILKALFQNCCLEELNLAGNVHPDETLTTSNGLISANGNSNSMTNCNTPDSPLKSSEPKVVEAPEQDLCALNTEDDQLQVPDSDDETVGGEDEANGLNENCPYLSQKSPSSSESGTLREILAAINMAKKLQLLDVSDNGFSRNVAEELYNAWSSSSPRAGLSLCHIQGKRVHLFVQGNKGCAIKPCCRRI